MQQQFDDGFFGVFLLIAAVFGMWAVSAYDKMVDRLKNKEDEN